MPSGLTTLRLKDGPLGKKYKLLMLDYEDQAIFLARPDGAIFYGNWVVANLLGNQSLSDQEAQQVITDNYTALLYQKLSDSWLRGPLYGFDGYFKPQLNIYSPEPTDWKLVCTKPASKPLLAELY